MLVTIVCYATVTDTPQISVAQNKRFITHTTSLLHGGSAPSCTVSAHEVAPAHQGLHHLECCQSPRQGKRNWQVMQWALKGFHVHVIGQSKSMALPDFKGAVQSGPTWKKEPGKC